MFMLSGPVELLFCERLIAFLVCVVLMSIGEVMSLDVCLSILLLLECVLCGMTLANCLLNCDAFCLLFMAVMLLNVIEVLGCVLGFLFARPASVFHSMCVSFVVPVVFKVFFPEVRFVCFY